MSISPIYNVNGALSPIYLKSWIDISLSNIPAGIFDIRKKEGLWVNNISFGYICFLNKTWHKIAYKSLYALLVDKENDYIKLYCDNKKKRLI